MYPRDVPRPTELRFQAGGVQLAGELLLPDGTPPPPGARWPWALLLPSWLARSRDGGYDLAGHPGWFDPAPMALSRPGPLARLAQALAAAGVASFRYDTRGCGASEGDWAGSDLFTRIDDARDAIGAMRSRQELDLARTGIVGHGEGAVIGLAVAIADPVIGALTLIGSPARSLRHVLRRAAASRWRGADRNHPLVAALDRSAEELIERVARHETEISLRLPTGDRLELSLRGWEQAFQTPALALATMLHRSVTLVQGDRDAWSHPDEARLLEAVLADGGNAPALRIVAGTGHDLDEAPDALFVELARDLAGRLEPRELPPVLIALEEQG